MTEDLEMHIIELTKIKGEVEEGSLKKWILFLENPEGGGNKKDGREIAQKLKSKNIRIEEIAEITGLTKEEIEKLKESYSKALINLKTKIK